jgi:hypothetical protein
MTLGLQTPLALGSTNNILLPEYNTAKSTLRNMLMLGFVSAPWHCWLNYIPFSLTL